MHRSLQISARKRKNFATMTDSMCQAHHLHRDFYCFSRNIKKKRGKHCLENKKWFSILQCFFFTNDIQLSKKLRVIRIVYLSEFHFQCNAHLLCKNLETSDFFITKCLSQQFVTKPCDDVYHKQDIDTLIKLSNNIDL